MNNNIEKVVLVNLALAQSFQQDEQEEFYELVISAGAEPVAIINGMRQAPDVKYFVGSGKVDDIRQALADSAAELVIFNHELSPSQQRNLEDALQARVLDRTGLILDIFAQRARTFEGKLQVELAQLERMATRLVRGWTHLERQKGGIGLRGPGETQLETDRRLIRQRIKIIKQRLQKVRTQRAQNRQSRQRKPVPTIALVGYTNAGKSTLFNSLTNASVYAADKLFATLDPTLRRVELAEFGEVIFADTVGFIQHLPHGLIDAFRATLEETRSADLLLHVIDVAHPQRDANSLQVEQVLKEIAADEILTLQVYNKIDLLPDFPPRTEYNFEQLPRAVYLSAQTGVGIAELKQAIVSQLSRDYLTQQLTLPPEQAKLRAQLHQLKAVLAEQLDEQGNWILQIRISKKDQAKLLS